MSHAYLSNTIVKFSLHCILRRHDTWHLKFANGAASLWAWASQIDPPLILSHAPPLVIGSGWCCRRGAQDTSTWSWTSTCCRLRRRSRRWHPRQSARMHHHLNWLASYIASSSYISSSHFITLFAWLVCQLINQQYFSLIPNQHQPTVITKQI